VKTKEAYERFYTGDEFNRLFDELIGAKLSMSRILLLLKEESLSTAEISEKLGLNPSDISRHMNTSSRYKFVRYDTGNNCYALP
jgi:predicted transcriptional regulator